MVSFYAVEVGARTSIPAKYLHNLLKTIIAPLSMPRGGVSSTLERLSKAALLDSYRIWLGREGNVGSGDKVLIRI
jgi:hypothetical protein